MRLLLILLALGGLFGCLREPAALTPSEAQRIAWYVEDVAHGHERDPYELVSADASAGMETLALWAFGRVRDGRSSSPPALLGKRQRRWPLLAQGLAEGAIRYREDGLLLLVAGLPDERRRLYGDDVEQENLDRQQLASILLARGGLHPDSDPGRGLLAELAAARVQHARAAGGQVWRSEQQDATPERRSASSAP